jgi:hypothetical protein
VFRLWLSRQVTRLRRLAGRLTGQSLIRVRLSRQVTWLRWLAGRLTGQALIRMMAAL